MNNSILVVAVFLAVAISHATYAEKATFAIDIVPSSKVRFANVSIEYHEGLPVILGEVKRIFNNSSVSPGHIDYLVKDPKGNVLIEGGVKYRPSISLRRRKLGSSFTIALPENLPTASVIQVGFHRNTHTPQKFSPVASHTENNLL